MLWGIEIVTGKLSGFYILTRLVLSSISIELSGDLLRAGVNMRKLPHRVMNERKPNASPRTLPRFSRAVAAINFSHVATRNDKILR